MFGVDRNELTRPRRGLHERTAGDERLLVGQREGAARLQGRQRWPQPDRTRDSVEYDVARPARQLRGGVGAGEDLGNLEPALGVAATLGLRVERQLEVLHDARLRHGHDVDAELERLFREDVGLRAARGHADDPEPVRIAAYDVHGLGTDRTGGAEEYDLTHADQSPPSVG